MSISAIGNIKNGLCFIKKNFGSLWLMLLKVCASLIPIIMIVGWSISSLIGRTPENFMTIDSSNIGVMTFVAGLLALLFMLLVASVLGVAITRSIVLDQSLDTRVFSKIFDKIVLKYAAVSLSLLISLVCFYATIGFLFLVFKTAGLTMYLSLSIIIPFLLYVTLRLQLIPYGVAMGDITSFSGAFRQTKGQVWNVFKVMFLAILIMILFEAFFELLEYVCGAFGETFSMVSRVTLLFFSLIFLPLSFLAATSMSYLYKSIR